MKKTHKVVMLPTEKASSIHVTPSRLVKWHMDITPTNKDCINQHLYILSDEEIKQGDWMISDLGSVGKIDYRDCMIKYNQGNFKKIVATTDKSLNENIKITESNYPLVRYIPESFIQAYIKAYNEGKPITKVDLEILECERHEECDGNFSNSCSGIKIKTRPDNTVIVHQSKIYSRDEVEALCLKAWSAGVNAEKDLRKYGEYTPFNKWVQDNL